MGRRRAKRIRDFWKHTPPCFRHEDLLKHVMSFGKKCRARGRGRGRDDTRDDCCIRMKSSKSDVITACLDLRVEHRRGQRTWKHPWKSCRYDRQTLWSALHSVMADLVSARIVTYARVRAAAARREQPWEKALAYGG
jgi:hypothetical protein